MKTFKIVLRDNREEYVIAQRHRHEGDQYVFESDGDTEVQFFIDSEVIGVYVVPEPPPPPPTLLPTYEEEELP